MVKNIHDICLAVKEEKSLTDDIIHRLTQQEIALYHWNVGRILCEHQYTDDELEELIKNLSFIDEELNDEKKIKEMIRFYRSNPDIYDVYFKDKGLN